MDFFAKQFIHFKNGTQRIQKTNHYILLTNISIKRCTETSFETDQLRGGRVPTRQVPYRQKQVDIYVNHSFVTLGFQAYSSATEFIRQQVSYFHLIIENFYYIECIR